MSDEFSPDPAQDAWQNQNVAPFHMSLDEIRRRIKQLDKNMRKRKPIGYAICLTGIALNILSFFLFPNLIQRIGCVLTVVALGYVLYQIRLYHLNRKEAATTAARKGSAASAEFYRSELQRLRDFTCGIWLWSRLVIIVPGPLVFMIGLQIAYPKAASIVYAEMAFFLILAALGIPLNLRISRKYQREINELESLQRDQ
ncbi:MAG: hypothetical protein ABSH28_14990 [Acidobacteriota bacterium]|jgi:Ca2+/Na+ antiporter